MASLIVDGRGSIKEVREIDPQFPDKKERGIDFDRVTAYLEQGRALMQEFEIGQREATWIPKPEYPNHPIFILKLSDIHYGSIGVDYALLREYLEIVENTPNFYLATNGDHVDNFNAIFHATGMTENPLPPQVQSRAIAKKLLELDAKGKIAVLSQGNHDRAGFVAGQDWFDTFLSEFRCPVFTRGGLLHAFVGGVEYKILMNHTYWGKSKINPINAVKRMIEYEGGGDIDVGWLGHIHQSDCEHFERGGKDVIAIISGTLKVDDPWAAQNGIGGRGQSSGITLMLEPHKRNMEVFKSIHNARRAFYGFGRD